MDKLANTEINDRRIAHVESCFGNAGQQLVESGRVLVGEGVLTKLCRKKPKLRQFFLFNDILVYGSIVISKKKYNKQHVMQLKDIKVEEIPDADTIVRPDEEGQGDTMKNGWLIISPTKSFAVYAQTAMEKQEWMSHMARGVEEQRMKSGVTTDPSNVAPPWIPDVEADQCMRCEKVTFNAIQRRHHCRKCGYVVCKGCSSQKAFIPYQSSKPMRVCDACFQAIKENPNSIERISPAKKTQSFFSRSTRSKQNDHATDFPSKSDGSATEILPSFEDQHNQVRPAEMEKYMDSSDSSGESEDENGNAKEN